MNHEIIGASPGRWWVAALLSYLGIVNGFTTVIFVTMNSLLTEYFKVSAKVVDWLYLGNACGSICFGVLMGTLAKYRHVTVKSWYLEALLLDAVCFTAAVAAFLDISLFPLLIVGIFLNGFSVLTFMALIPITASVWFREKEQATIYGLGTAAKLVGDGMAAVAPSLFLSSGISAEDKIEHFGIIMTVIFATICVITVFVVMATWKFLQDLPRFPPTLAEARRLRIIDESQNETFCDMFKEFAGEIWILVKDRTSVFLILTYDIALAAMIFHFMFLPQSREFSESNYSSVIITQDAHKAYMLSCLAGGGIIGSITFGRALDMVKSYRILASLLGICLPLSSVLTFICYWFPVPIAPYVAIFLYGGCIGATMSFCGEMVKQYVYPNVSEITQGITRNCFSYILQVIFAQVFRFVIDTYGNVWFYLMDFLLCLCAPFLLLSVNPPLNRFLYQTLPE